METEAQAAGLEAERPAAEIPQQAVSEPAASAAELEAARALAEERYKELQYARAEIENVRKRAQRIADERLLNGRRQLLSKFLPVIDNLQRAVLFNDSEGLRGGLQATLRGFEGLLSSEGVKAVEVLGKPFDPRVAEAIGTRDSTEVDDDIVLDEAQRGYLLGEELLRPASVIVAKRIEARSAQE
ncbi:MAG: nucleotide exchange factor GrpE [Candidatus Baltobacteraceae bacterium]|jgi:molecular chaperone GrpE